MILLSEAIRRLKEARRQLGDVPVVFADGEFLMDIILKPTEKIDTGHPDDEGRYIRSAHVIVTDRNNKGQSHEEAKHEAEMKIAEQNNRFSYAGLHK